ncbi:hypothetical protein CCH79_00018918 [Gambusia affinis]|uniref:EGF-like domain-containing protein n=1 Tax=Gambusia affinis TaxID=33528 RepID=A0A315VK63_GAMAF|nr:hypothetical protein CCH79_00018918 [Gambusia affinis]
MWAESPGRRPPVSGGSDPACTSGFCFCLRGGETRRRFEAPFHQHHAEGKLVRVDQKTDVLVGLIRSQEKRRSFRSGCEKAFGFLKEFIGPVLKAPAKPPLSDAGQDYFQRRIDPLLGVGLFRPLMAPESHSADETDQNRAELHSVHCDSVCSEGLWGPNCSSSCSCENGGSCSPEDGGCVCAAGYRGTNCRRSCPSGFYGAQCSEVCRCQNGADCDHIGGHCSCRTGFMGPSCELSESPPPAVFLSLSGCL